MTDALSNQAFKLDNTWHSECSCAVQLFHHCPLGWRLHSMVQPFPAKIYWVTRFYIILLPRFSINNFDDLCNAEKNTAMYPMQWWFVGGGGKGGRSHIIWSRWEYSNSLDCLVLRLGHVSRSPQNFVLITLLAEIVNLALMIRIYLDCQLLQPNDRLRRPERIGDLHTRAGCRRCS